MNPDTWGVVILLGAQTAGLFYWGGKLSQTVRDHERRISEIKGKQDTGLERLSHVETHMEDHLRQAM